MFGSRRTSGRLALQGVVPERRADEAVRDLLDLRITRYRHLVLLPRIWQLRHNLCAHYAVHIVLAEKFGAVLLHLMPDSLLLRAMAQPSSSSNATNRTTHPLVLDILPKHNRPEALIPYPSGQFVPSETFAKLVCKCQRKHMLDRLNPQPM